MTAAATFALIELRDSLAGYFAMRGRLVDLVFGFGSRKQHTQSAERIAIEPGQGDGPRRSLHSGIVNPLQVGDVEDTAFGQVGERFQLFCFAHDASAPADPAVQCRAVSVLHDAVCEAILLSGLDISIDSADWVVSSEINMYGAGIVIRGTATRFMYSEAADTTRQVMPWSAQTRVHADDEYVETIDSPPQEPPP